MEGEEEEERSAGYVRGSRGWSGGSGTALARLIQYCTILYSR